MSDTATHVLWRVTAPHFVAGVEVDEEGYVCAAAPILNWALGKYWYQVKGVISHKYRWHLERVSETTRSNVP